MVDSADKVKAFENFTLDAAADAPAAEQKPAAAEEKPAAAAPKKPKKKKVAAAGGGASTSFPSLFIKKISQGFPKHQKVAMPALSPTMKNVSFLSSKPPVLNFLLGQDRNLVQERRRQARSRRRSL